MPEPGEPEFDPSAETQADWDRLIAESHQRAGFDPNELRNLFGPKIGDEIIRNVNARIYSVPPDTPTGGVLFGGPRSEVHVFGSPDPALVAKVDQAMAEARTNRADGPQAAAELRCAAPPIGCGRPLPSGLSTAFRDRESRAEYDVTHLCQSCQDLTWAHSPEEVMEMALDPERYGRCCECGEYRPYEFVDVGVGVIKGFDCCPAMHGHGSRLPRCQRTPGCEYGADHQHGCEASDDAG
jgi:hypothetical protein